MFITYITNNQEKTIKVALEQSLTMIAKMLKHKIRLVSVASRDTKLIQGEYYAV